MRARLRTSVTLGAVTAATFAGTPAFAANNLVTTISIGDAYDTCVSAYHDNDHELSVDMLVTGAQQDGVGTATLQAQRSGSGTYVSLCTSGVFTPTTGVVTVLLKITFNGATVHRYAYCTTVAGAKSCTGTGEVSQ